MVKRNAGMRKMKANKHRDFSEINAIFKETFLFVTRFEITTTQFVNEHSTIYPIYKPVRSTKWSSVRL